MTRRRECTSDLSRNPSTFAGLGPLPCQVTGEHEQSSDGFPIHERTTGAIPARWVDIPEGRRLTTVPGSEP